MREILFRGKRRDNGEWVEGFIGGLHSYKTDEETGKITRIDSYYLNHQSVDAITVGQYTGLTDKNGKKIFEGDIVKIEPVKHKEEIQIQGRNYKISELKGCWIMLNDEEKWEFLGSIANSVVVVGNIHDNPELLEVRNE